MDDLRISVDDTTAEWLREQAAKRPDRAVGRLIEDLVAERGAIEREIGDSHLFLCEALRHLPISKHHPPLASPESARGTRAK